MKVVVVGAGFAGLAAAIALPECIARVLEGPSHHRSRGRAHAGGLPARLAELVVRFARQVH